MLGEAFSAAADPAPPFQTPIGCQRLSSTPVGEVAQNSDPAALEVSGGRLCLFVFCFQPRFSAGVRPPAVLPSDRGKQHPSQPPRPPLRSTRVFAAARIVGIQHPSVYWSQCGSKRSPPGFSFSLFFFFCCLANKTVE